MVRREEQNRETPDAVKELRLEPEAAPVDKTVKQVFDEGGYNTTQGALGGLAQIGQGLVHIEDTLQRKANENALNAEYKTQEENKNKWSEVSRNIKGMAKFNPYNDDAFRRIIAGNITSKKIAEMKGIPELEKMSPTEASAKFGEVAQSMTSEFKQAGLEPNDVYYSLDKFDKERKHLEQTQIVANTAYNYKRVTLARTYDLGINIDRNIYNFDNFDKIAHAGQVEQGNIDINNRTVLQNEDGSFSTEKSITIEKDNSFVVLPTIIDGKEVSPEDAIKHFEETGQHLGKFESQETADFYAQELHLRQAYYYGGRGKAEATLDYLNKYTAQLQKEGTPDDTIGGIVLSAFKQAVTRNPQIMTSPEWTRILSDYRINGQPLDRILPDATYEMQQFIREAKRAAFNDRQLEHAQEQLEMELKTEQAMVEYMAFMEANPTGDREAKAKELCDKFGLVGVYRTKAYDTMTKGYTSLSDLKTVTDDPETVTALLTKAVNGSLTVGDVLNASRQKKLSPSTISHLYNKIEERRREAKAEARANRAERIDMFNKKASFHIERTTDTLFGNSKKGYQGIIKNNPALKEQLSKEIEDIVHRYEITGNYKELNDSLATLKSKAIRMQQKEGQASNNNGYWGYIKQTARNLKKSNYSLTQKQKNEAIAKHKTVQHQLETKHNIFRTSDRKHPDKGKTVQMGDYTVKGNKGLKVASPNGRCYVPYSVKNVKGMYVADVTKSKDGNSVVLYVPNRGFVSYHHLQDAGLPYVGMPVTGDTVLGNMKTNNGAYVEVQFFDRNGNVKTINNW